MKKRFLVTVMMLMVISLPFVFAETNDIPASLGINVAYIGIDPSTATTDDSVYGADPGTRFKVAARIKSYGIGVDAGVELGNAIADQPIRFLMGGSYDILIPTTPLYLSPGVDFVFNSFDMIPKITVGFNLSIIFIELTLNYSIFLNSIGGGIGSGFNFKSW
ncbi:MAG: hypothetical protein LBM77_01610 [Spirochaetaceae bacterium]|jgi:hypothetical protein|nr:hypothetical protein [Spirochaetaceae bacterium]